jgi:hypothetical protein
MSMSTSSSKDASDARSARKKTHVARFQIQIDAVTRKGGNEAARIRRHQRLLLIFAAAIARASRSWSKENDWMSSQMSWKSCIRLFARPSATIACNFSAITVSRA